MTGRLRASAVTAAWSELPWSQGGPPGRAAAAFAWSAPNRGLLLFGGIDAEAGAVDETWVRVGSSWSAAPGAERPPARADAMLVPCGPDGSLLLFGGLGPVAGDASSGMLGDSWVWDGSRWSASPGPGPSPRSTAAMAFDPVRDEVVLFGGLSADREAPFLGDTWVWSEGLWAQRDPASAPGPRLAPAMAFDQNLDRILLFGGGSGPLLADTWSWDGSAWAEIQTAHQPPARHRSGMIFHPGLAGAVLFSGLGVPPLHGSAALDDTWLFDGADWRPLDTSGAVPPGGDSRNFAFDPDLGAGILATLAGGPRLDPTSRRKILRPLELSTWAL